MFSVWRPSWLPAAGLSSKRLCFKAQSKDSCCWICKGCLRCVCQQGSAGYQQAHLVSGMEAADAAPLSAGPHAAEAACTHAAGAVPPPPVPARQAVSKPASSPAAQAPQGFHQHNRDDNPGQHPKAKSNPCFPNLACDAKGGPQLNL